MIHLTDFPLDRQSSSHMVCVCSGLEHLMSAGLSDRYELSLWKRGAQLPRDVLEKLSFDQFTDFRDSGSGACIRACLRDFLKVQTSWPLAVRSLIEADLASVLAKIPDAEAEYTLRLECVRDDACRRFHKDQTDVRLISTYVGRGTQWIVDDDEGGVINEMETFEIGIFRGQRWGIEEAVLHRSPPIEGSGEARLLMVLDIERQGWAERARGI